MLSPNKEDFISNIIGKHKNVSRNYQNHQFGSQKEKSNKMNNGDFFNYNDFDKESIASTYDSSQRTKLYNTSQSDNNILRYKRLQQTKNHPISCSNKEFNTTIKLTSSNNPLLKKDSLWSTTSTPREKRKNETYSDSFVQSSRQYDFKRKTSKKQYQQHDLGDSYTSRGYQKSQKDLLNSQASSYRQSRDVPCASQNKVSFYENLRKSSNKPMFIQRKESYGQQALITSSHLRKDKTQSKQHKQISVSDFQIGKSCGKGMYGNVYAAKLRSNGTLYALKKISKDVVIKNKMQAQLALEIKLQMFLDHPNILKLYHFFEDQKNVYLVMQYMQGGSLFDYMQKRNEKMTEKEAALIITQISNALNYLHDLDIIHRDIKPQNIVISNGVHKLCDFGWATICKDRRSTYCGTFDYASPQILEGKQYDQKVDLWCLGVLTYQLLTQKVPFYDASRKQSIKKIINSDKHKAEIPMSISTKCRHFIEKLMRKNPQQRLRASDLHSHPYLAMYLPKQRFFY